MSSVSPLFPTVESVRLPLNQNISRHPVQSLIYAPTCMLNKLAICLQSFIWELGNLRLKGEVKIQRHTLSTLKGEQNLGTLKILLSLTQTFRYMYH